MTNLEIGKSVQLGPVATNYHDIGEGAPVLLIHGSGPGVSAWANWRLPLGAQPAFPLPRARYGGLWL
jgi:2-hydroxymuconate-semialdehyde hydrolase